MDIYDTLQAIATLIIGAICGVICTWYYYRRTSRDLKELQSSLESQGETIFRLLNDQNPSKTGELKRTPEGKWVAKWNRTISESIHITDEVKANVIRPNRSNDKDQ
jgi:hypothetical protein